MYLLFKKDSQSQKFNERQIAVLYECLKASFFSNINRISYYTHLFGIYQSFTFAIENAVCTNEGF